MQEREDAYGREVYDYQHNQTGYEIVERDDGFVDLSAGPCLYFSTYEEWDPYLKEAIAYARGRVVDIGCGAGRHALYLQEQGLAVLGVDASPLAVEVCRLRGLRQVQQLSVTRMSVALGVFDTLLMLGNNFGLFGNYNRARWLLRRFHGMTSDQGRIIAESRNPYDTDDPDHLAYHERNRRRGRMGGQVRIRIRYRKFASLWFDYLLASPEEVSQIVQGTGWHLARVIPSGGPQYAVIIEKDAHTA